MTSNLGSHQIQDMSAAGDYEGVKKAVMDIVGQHFRPEFINRVDETVVFHPLGREQIRSIANIQIEHLRQRLQEKDIALDVSDAALDKLGEAGFDPVYGARPLKRAIQQYLENPLAQQLLVGDYVEGDVIRVDLKDGEISFGKLQSVKAAV